mgnify:CR=1 FL=1
MLRRELEKKVNELFENEVSFILTSAEVKENDYETYFYLHDILLGFVHDKHNLADEKDLLNYENGEYLVRYDFLGDVLHITAGANMQQINNQIPWTIEKRKNVIENLDDEVLLYYVVQAQQG